MRKLLDLRMAEVRQTTTFRLTAALGIVFLVAVVALLGITYALTESEQAARSDLVLYREAQLLASAPPGKRVAAVNAAVTGNASGLLYFALYDAAGRKLAGNVNFDARKQSHAMPERTFERPAGGGLPVPMRMLVRQLGDGETLVLGRDNKTTIDLRARILGILLASGLAVVASAAAAAVGLSIGPLRRIGELKVAARRIAAGELGWRMPVSRRMDELDLIAGMVNTMIDEIERLMEQVKGATDAIAHDLRAPLARLRFRLEEMREPVADVPGRIDGAIEDLDMVLARFTALLRISEIEVSGRRSGFAGVDLMTLIAQVGELYEPLADERDVTLSMHGSYGHVVECDEGLMLEGLSNLVDNALKFTEPGGEVSLAVLVRPEGVAIEVRDNGPGIAPAERSLVLRRFYRGAASRTVAGTGLGLNLVAAIAHLHGFALELDDAAPGLIVRVVCYEAA